MNYGKLLTTACLLLLCGALFAQNASRKAGGTQLKIIVKDQETGFAIPDASIQLTNPEGRASALGTAANGQLQLQATNGRNNFIITAPGYQPLETYFITGTDSLIEANIHLDPVTARVSAIQAPPNKLVLSGYIRDGNENAPLAGALVSAGNQTAVTDSKGYFQLSLSASFKTVAPGSVPDILNVRVSKDGYVPYNIQNFYAIPDTYSMKIALSRAKPGARQAEETEVQQHGLFDRKDSDEQARYANVPAIDNARVSDAAGALAISVPSTIRVGTSCSCTSCSVVNVMSLESYTQSGLDEEWIASWAAPSLQAGAVAYRTYGAWYVLHPVASSYDIAATTCNQAWASDVNNNAKNAAIATQGTVLIRNNAIFRSEYSAENNNSGCGNGYSGTGSSWPCISDARCAGRTKNGHGRGMCQWGSSFWASDKTYLWILDHYYTPGGVSVQLPPSPAVTTITFTVKNQETGAAIPTTSVAITAPNGSTSTQTTDASGKLVFGANSGVYGFSFSKSGYNTLRTSFTGGPNATITADVNLDPTGTARIAENNERRAVAGHQMTVNGYIRDADEHNGLQDVQVQIGQYKAVTNQEGFFSISIPALALTRDQQPAVVSIKASKTGYAGYTINNFYLLPDTYTVQMQLERGNNEVSERRLHGLFDRIATGEQELEAPAARSGAITAAAAAVPASIRVATSCDCSTCTGITIQVMSLEAYVETGLDDEWLSSWNAASLQAGAVAYRSRGAYYVQHPVAANYDLSGASCHQTWQSDRAASVKTATAATAGIVLVKNNQIVNAAYCAESNNAGCGNGFSGTGTTWPCIADSRCAGRTTSGHGRGMCQWGSSFWGTDQSFSWILNHYYNPDSTYIQLPGALANATPETALQAVSSLRLSPNPATGSQVKLAYTVATAQRATVTVMDNFGRTVRQQQLNLQAGNNNLDLYTGKLKPGVYTVNIRFAAGGRTESSKLVVGSK